MGTTAARLPELFAAPIIVAVATVRLAAIIAATAVVLVPPLTFTEVFKRGDPALSAEFYTPLLDQLVARGAVAN